MTETTSPILAAATLLAARRRSGEQGSRLPEWCRPLDVDTALAIQMAVAEQLDDGIGAWKCGLPVQERVTLAPIYGSTIYSAAPCPAWMRDQQVMVEPELAFLFGTDLPARTHPYRTEDIDAAIGATHLALELIDCRYRTPSEANAAEHLADGLFNQGLFIGPQVNDEQARQAAVLTIEVVHSSGTRITLDGRHPSTTPRAPLYWLVEYLRAMGVGLRAGQAVITGSYAGSFGLPVGQQVALRFGELGSLEVQFTSR